jgi:hypothetical protein
MWIEDLRSLHLVEWRNATCLATLLHTTKCNTFKLKKDNEKKTKNSLKEKEKHLQENNKLFVYFFHSVEVCCKKE